MTSNTASAQSGVREWRGIGSLNESRGLPMTMRVQWNAIPRKPAVKAASAMIANAGRGPAKPPASASHSETNVPAGGRPATPAPATISSVPSPRSVLSTPVQWSNRREPEARSSVPPSMNASDLANDCTSRCNSPPNNASGVPSPTAKSTKPVCLTLDHASNRLYSPCTSRNGTAMTMEIAPNNASRCSGHGAPNAALAIAKNRNSAAMLTADSAVASKAVAGAGERL